MTVYCRLPPVDSLLQVSEYNERVNRLESLLLCASDEQGIKGSSTEFYNEFEARVEKTDSKAPIKQLAGSADCSL